MKKVIAFAAACLAMLLTGCQSSQPLLQESQLSSVTGSISYRERIALPSHALVTVTIQDVSLADAPAKVIAKHRFETNGYQVPYEFELSYDKSKIDARHRYSVSVRIEVDGQLRFISDTMNSVITDSDNTDNIAIQLVSVGR